MQALVSAVPIKHLQSTNATSNTHSAPPQCRDAKQRQSQCRSRDEQAETPTHEKQNRRLDAAWRTNRIQMQREKACIESPIGLSGLAMQCKGHYQTWEQACACALCRLSSGGLLELWEEYCDPFSTLKITLESLETCQLTSAGFTAAWGDPASGPLLPTTDSLPASRENTRGTPPSMTTVCAAKLEQSLSQRSPSSQAARANSCTLFALGHTQCASGASVKRDDQVVSEPDRPTGKRDERAQPASQGA
ncbi:hypothetical protein GLAREA_10591 [Glarea lozoyensis ATCC 20868]|uniref:Uncharacterized protein n=1 Tax=Glarea lozoyensis (strain ATCC 20868 / MF5171) TaxID=1116229 RepID=S3DSG1_GLAL2|nr:uncharacterized protein GLAREA_10591 [Glarea lozoyensis ATCC 20868]EPE34896.1 hypothetical protein GLAREA_10591 [Glarea lozoyensis ATCC 20868]